MKVLLDMNVSPDLASELNSRGTEAIHWSSVGAIRAPDWAILEYARNHGFVILTHDLDFGVMLIASGETKPSVVQLRFKDLIGGAIAEQVLSALRNAAAELNAGALVTVGPQRIRVRVLALDWIE